MKPIHKHLFDQKEFPFHIVYKDKKSPQVELPDHFHEWNEIILIHSGNGVVFIDQTFHHLTKGDIVMIPTNTIHRVIPEKSNLIVSTAIFFSPTLIHHTGIGDPFAYLNIFAETKKTKRYKYAASSKDMVQLEYYVDQLIKEDQSEYKDKENAIILWIHLILLTIQRILLQKMPLQLQQPKHEPHWLREALTYINQHISVDLNLSDIAENVSVSEAHLSRVFKQFVGMTISNYITIKRIHLAKDLLVNSHMKVSSIAQQCGFNSIPYFYRAFKKITSMTPTEFRKK